MRYIDEFRDKDVAKRLADEIAKLADREITLMEVCGTHTMALFRFGLRKLLPDKIRLLSGPGCPVCVTENHYIDKAIAYAREDGVTVTTFGDMMKVPGSASSLEKEKADGRDVRIVYSTSEALQIARQNLDRVVVFLGVGFETTSPTIAASLIEAKDSRVDNYFVLCGHKLIPPALRALIETPELRLDGFILPGHVSTVIGSRPYEFVAGEFHVPCVVTGFEPIDILQGIYMLTRQVTNKEAKVEIQYTRSVKPEGNPRAQALIDEVFEATDSEWRGLGIIPDSGLKIRSEFSDLDIEKRMDVEVPAPRRNSDCICGSILRGLKTPLDCKLFGKGCTPENPQGACMVSTEGTCSAYYRYGG